MPTAPNAAPSWLADMIREELEPNVEINDDSFPVEFGSTTAICPASSIECPDDVTVEADFDEDPIPVCLDVTVNDVDLRLKLTSVVRLKCGEHRCVYAVSICD